MKSVVVTGGAGYIGSHTCKLLSKLGYHPIVYDNLTTGHESFVKWGPLVIGDLHDNKKFVDTFNEHRPIAVVHFAASAYVGESVAHPFKYYQNNVGGTLSLLEAMRAASINKLVFSSTCATYGIPDTQLISEENPQNPINPYGQTKVMIERILRDLSTQDQIRHVSLRYFNAAGADPEGELGEWHEPETHLIPLAIRSALGGEPLSIFGDDFPTPDGTPVRDYIHVQDLAMAHLLAIEYLMNDGESSYLNLGTGVGNSVREIIEGIRIYGLTPKAIVGPRREGDPAYLVADATKAQRVLGWAPHHTDIKSILETAISWHKRHG